MSELYIRIGLQKTNRKDVKFFYVHRLVAQAFIPNIENKPFINHKDENKQNNNVFINVDKFVLNNLPDDYIWVDYRTLCDMM